MECGLLVGASAGVVDAVGVGWYTIGTRGGEISYQIWLKEVEKWSWYGYSYPWRWMPRYWRMTPYSLAVGIRI